MTEAAQHEATEQGACSGEARLELGEICSLPHPTPCSSVLQPLPNLLLPGHLLPSFYPCSSSADVEAQPFLGWVDPKSKPSEALPGPWPSVCTHWDKGAGPPPASSCLNPTHPSIPFKGHLHQEAFQITPTRVITLPSLPQASHFTILPVPLLLLLLFSR